MSSSSSSSKDETVDGGGGVGPIPSSNWVVPGSLCAGGYPGSVDEQVAHEYAQAMATARFDTYVCLMESDELARFRPYTELIASAGAQLTPPLPVLDHVHFPIPDRGLPRDETDLLALVRDMLARMSQGRKLYVHCWGGHGRTGTVVAVLLAHLHGISAKTSLIMWKQMHHTRTHHATRASPEARQAAFVRRLLDKVEKK